MDNVKVVYFLCEGDGTGFFIKPLNCIGPSYGGLRIHQHGLAQGLMATVCTNGQSREEKTWSSRATESLLGRMTLAKGAQVCFASALPRFL